MCQRGDERTVAPGALCALSALALAIAALGIGVVGGAAERAARNRFDVVVIDAGHGGEDKGAHGPHGQLEKDLVLDVARELSVALRSSRLRVVMTRERDVFVPLEARNAIANDARGDLFISIHANAAPDREIRGSETFFLSLRASDDSARRVALRENEAFRTGGASSSPVDDPLLAIIGDLINKEHMKESNEFARMAQAELAGIDPQHSRGVKQAPFVVLTGVQMPGSLIEIGFITNPQESEMLHSGRGRSRVVSALARAVVAFGERYDARRGVVTEPASAEGGL